MVKRTCWLIRLCVKLWRDKESAADTAAATTMVKAMHRKRLMIGKFPGGAQSRADESCSAPRRRCK